MKNTLSKTLRLISALSFCTASAFAGSALTAAGVTEGFTLSTFASNFPTTGYCCGPLGIAFVGSGVLVTDYPGNVRTFTTDTDGQDAASFAPSAAYGTSGAVGLAQLGSNYYITQQTGEVIQVNSDGTFNQNIFALGGATGIAADAVNGMIYVSGSSLYAIDPILKTGTVFKSGGFDGLSVDVTNQILYAEGGNHIYGFRIATGTQIFDSGFISGGPDGVAIGTGTLAGKLFVNVNDGTIVEVDIATLAQTVIASGGSRGDFVTVDPNGSLLLTQTDSIIRLTAGGGGGFDTGTPEPGTLAMMFGACAFAAPFVRRRLSK